MKLTKSDVEGFKPRPAEYFEWCSDPLGFGVRVYPSGKKSYLVQYRAGGRSRRAVIGLHGRLTTEEARKEAKALLGKVAKGGDPAGERAEKRAQATTVAELCARYLEAAECGLIHGKSGPKKPSTLVTDRSRINTTIIPLLGRKRLHDLTRADVSRFIRDVAEGKTAADTKTDKLRGRSIVTGGAGAATRTAGLLGGMLSFAVDHGLIPTNPALGVRRPAYKSKSARLTPDDYKSLGRALALAENEGAHTSGIAAVRLLALTGCRAGEVMRLTWPEVDTTGQALRLKDSKEGASVRPIGRAVLDVLASLPRRSGVPWVLPGRDTGPYGGLQGTWARLIVKAGLSGVSPHTLRHSFASVAGDMGYSESTIAAMIGHAAGSTTGRYTHHLDAVLIAAADKVAAEIAGYLGTSG